MAQKKHSSTNSNMKCEKLKLIDVYPEGHKEKDLQQ